MRKRMISPGFFIDEELVEHFDAWGRLFYQGLWCVAEDSGCFELKPLQLKMQIFPGDNITTDKINVFLQKLSELGKIVVYKVDGKEYAWIKNFHKHQTLNKPTPPQIPLPEWIIFEGQDVHGKERHKWEYIVHDMPRASLGQVISSAVPEENRIEKNRKEVNRNKKEVRTKSITGKEVRKNISELLQQVKNYPLSHSEHINKYPNGKPHPKFFLIKTFEDLPEEKKIGTLVQIFTELYPEQKKHGTAGAITANKIFSQVVEYDRCPNVEAILKLIVYHEGGDLTLWDVERKFRGLTPNQPPDGQMQYDIDSWKYKEAVEGG